MCGTSFKFKMPPVTKSTVAILKRLKNWYDKSFTWNERGLKLLFFMQISNHICVLVRNNLNNTPPVWKYTIRLNFEIVEENDYMSPLTMMLSRLLADFAYWKKFVIQFRFHYSSDYVYNRVTSKYRRPKYHGQKTSSIINTSYIVMYVFQMSSKLL